MALFLNEFYFCWKHEGKTYAICIGKDTPTVQRVEHINCSIADEWGEGRFAYIDVVKGSFLKAKFNIVGDAQTRRGLILQIVEKAAKVKTISKPMQFKSKPAKLGLPYNNQQCFYSVAVYSTTGNKTFYFRSELAAKKFNSLCKKKNNYKKSYLKKLPIK